MTTPNHHAGPWGFLHDERTNTWSLVSHEDGSHFLTDIKLAANEAPSARRRISADLDLIEQAPKLYADLTAALALLETVNQAGQFPGDFAYETAAMRATIAAVQGNA